MAKPPPSDIVDDRPPPPAGHNQPPEEKRLLDPEWLREDLDRRFSAFETESGTTLDFAARAAEFRKKIREMVASMPRIENDVQQGQVGDLRKAMREYLKLCELQHGIVKDPYRQCGLIVDSFFNQMSDGVDAEDKVRITVTEKRAKRTVPISVMSGGMLLRDMQDAYALKLEEESRAAAEAAAKKAAEEAAAVLRVAAATLEPAALDAASEAAKAAEEAAAHAAAPAAVHSRVHGDSGSVTSLRTTWDFEVVDYQALYAAAAGVPGRFELLTWAKSLQLAIGDIGLGKLEAATKAIERVFELMIPKSYPTGASVYVQPDEVAIRRAVTGGKAGRDGNPGIPGVKIFQVRRT